MPFLQMFRDNDMVGMPAGIRILFGYGWNARWRPFSPRFDRVRSGLGWKFGHQPQRNCQLVKLEVRAEVGDRIVGTRLSRDLAHFNPRVAQRESGLLLLRR